MYTQKNVAHSPAEVKAPPDARSGRKSMLYQHWEQSGSPDTFEQWLWRVEGKLRAHDSARRHQFAEQNLGEARSKIRERDTLNQTAAGVVAQIALDEVLSLRRDVKHLSDVVARHNRQLNQIEADLAEVPVLMADLANTLPQGGA